MSILLIIAYRLGFIFPAKLDNSKCKTMVNIFSNLFIQKILHNLHYLEAKPFRHAL